MNNRLKINNRFLHIRISDILLNKIEFIKESQGLDSGSQAVREAISTYAKNCGLND